MVTNILYLRVSHKDRKNQEEAEQDIVHQREALLQKFKPENPLILEDKGSAYNLENTKNRPEFIQMLDVCFGNTGVTDLFLQNYEKKEITIYVWDLNRIMRNLKFNLLFSVLASVHNIKVCSYHDTFLTKNNSDEEDYDKEFLSLLLAVLAAKKAEDYSRDISKNIKKAFFKEKNSSYSRKGNKVGRKFKDAAGLDIDLTADRENEIVEYIEKQIQLYMQKRIKGFYPLLKKSLVEKYGIGVSSGYLSNIKTRLSDD